MTKKLTSHRRTRAAVSSNRIVGRDVRLRRALARYFRELPRWEAQWATLGPHWRYHPTTGLLLNGTPPTNGGYSPSPLGTLLRELEAPNEKPSCGGEHDTTTRH